MSKRTTFQQIRELPFLHQALLACYLSARMRPNYDLFHRVTGFGDPKVLQGALDVVWHWLGHGGKANFARWQEKIDEQTPSEHGHDLLGVYPAMEACVAISTLLQGLLDKEDKPLLDVAKVSQGSVAHFLELTEGAEMSPDDRQQMLQEHELVEYEIAMQQAMVTFLQGQPEITADLVKMVRSMVEDEGISNLGLAIDTLSEAPSR
ncbi:YjaG family protein [Aliidiomarina soli]|uniref:DUF416 domain-containing protein n=1 Tax=Aliidiomarina soli TaxID=1928574 RepID=A0A432WJK9_9GAMM|nr:YjaG family protein [Aliidiomarina soli]RUO33887.1 DUF416 domain-containing protein [Aliidiomarina soli]